MDDVEARRFLVRSAGRLNFLTALEIDGALERAGEGQGGPLQWAIREGVLLRPVLRAMLGEAFLAGATAAGLLDRGEADRLAGLGRTEAEHLEATRATRMRVTRIELPDLAAEPATRLEPAPVAAPSLADVPPAWLGGYRIVRWLGDGGMARVYLAEKDGEPYALKVLLPEIAARPEYLRRFEREGNVAGRLVHPHIVRVHRAGVERGTAYLVMEYVPGRTLAEAVRGRLPLGPAEALEIVTALAGALVHAHSKGVLHRDVKPENVLVPDEGPIRLADFGLVKEIGRVVADRDAVYATPHQVIRIEELFRVHLLEVLEKSHVPVDLERRLEEIEAAVRSVETASPIEFSVDSLARLRNITRLDDLTHSVGVTASGECLGTPLYMSPEQFAGRLTDGRTDVFSLGVLYFHLLTGTHPWPGSSLSQIGRRKLTRDAPAPDGLAPGVPPEHAAVVLKMLARHPEERYPTLRFALCDLERLARGEAPLLSPPSWWEEAISSRASGTDPRENRTESYEFLTGLWLDFLSQVRFVEDDDAIGDEQMNPE